MRFIVLPLLPVFSMLLHSDADREREELDAPYEDPWRSDDTAAPSKTRTSGAAYGQLEDEDAPKKRFSLFGRRSSGESGTSAESVVSSHQASSQQISADGLRITSVGTTWPSYADVAPVAPMGENAQEPQPQPAKKRSSMMGWMRTLARMGPKNGTKAVTSNTAQHAVKHTYERRVRWVRMKNTEDQGRLIRVENNMKQVNTAELVPEGERILGKPDYKLHWQEQVDSLELKGLFGIKAVPFTQIAWREPGNKKKRYQVNLVMLQVVGTVERSDAEVGSQLERQAVLTFHLVDLMSRRSLGVILSEMVEERRSLVSFQQKAEEVSDQVVEALRMVYASNSRRSRKNSSPALLDVLTEAYEKGKTVSSGCMACTVLALLQDGLQFESSDVGVFETSPFKVLDMRHVQLNSFKKAILKAEQVEAGGESVIVLDHFIDNRASKLVEVRRVIASSYGGGWVTPVDSGEEDVWRGAQNAMTLGNFITTEQLAGEGSYEEEEDDGVQDGFLRRGGGGGRLLGGYARQTGEEKGDGDHGKNVVNFPAREVVFKTMQDDPSGRILSLFSPGEVTQVAVKDGKFRKQLNPFWDGQPEGVKYAAAVANVAGSPQYVRASLVAVSGFNSPFHLAALAVGKKSVYGAPLEHNKLLLKKADLQQALQLFLSFIPPEKVKEMIIERASDLSTEIHFPDRKTLLDRAVAQTVVSVTEKGGSSELRNKMVMGLKLCLEAMGLGFEELEWRPLEGSLSGGIVMEYLRN